MSSDLDNLISSVDNKYLNIHKYKGLVGFKVWRKYYNLGPVSNFLPENTVNDELILNFDTQIDTSEIDRLLN